MVSTIIISPKHNENIPSANKNFTVVLAVDNLDAGQFTNPDTTYYSAPQQLNKNGNILGHTHITIQVRP
jgi:transcription initiation factor TFIID subunit 15